MKKTKEKNTKVISEKQKIFADTWIELGNAEQAAIKAGYSKAYSRGNAYKLVAKSGIKEYIEKRLKELETKRVATLKEVLEFYTSVMRGEVKDQFGLDPTLADRLKAAEGLGKRFGAFDKIDESDKKPRTLTIEVIKK